MVRCDFRQHSECGCPAGECDDQTRHQRIADLFARQKAERERFLHGTRNIARGASVVAILAFIGIFYAAAIRADEGSRKYILETQENIHVARR